MIIFAVPLLIPFTIPFFDTVATFFWADLYVTLAPFGTFFTLILVFPPTTILTDFFTSFVFAAASTVSPVPDINEITIRRDSNRAANFFVFFFMIIQSFLRYYNTPSVPCKF